MRLARALVVCAAALSAGCLSSSAVIRVNPDGSGTITNTMLLKTAAMEMLKATPSDEAETAEEKTDSPPPLFSEEKLRGELPRMGEGVTFVSVQPLKQPNWEGATITYAFKDISKVRFNLRSEMMESTGGDRPEVVTFRFAPAAAGAPAKLTIVMPKTDFEKAAGEPSKASGKEDSALAKAMLEQFKPMFDGMRVTVAVDVGGPVVRTNAEHVSGSTVTLFDLDVTEMLKSFSDLESFDSISRGGMTLADVRKKLKQVNGLKMALEPEVRVEFGAPGR